MIFSLLRILSCDSEFPHLIIDYVASFIENKQNKYKIATADVSV